MYKKGSVKLIRGIYSAEAKQDIGFVSEMGRWRISGMLRVVSLSTMAVGGTHSFSAVPAAAAGLYSMPIAVGRTSKSFLMTRPLDSSRGAARAASPRASFACRGVKMGAADLEGYSTKRDTFEPQLAAGQGGGGGGGGGGRRGGGGGAGAGWVENAVRKTLGARRGGGGGGGFKPPWMNKDDEVCEIWPFSCAKFDPFMNDFLLLAL